MAKLWVAMRCASDGAEMVATFEESDSAWRLTDAQADEAGAGDALLPGGLRVDGEFLVHERYGGCPRCGTPSFFRCGCGGISCFVGGKARYRCPWCAKKGRSATGVDSIEASDRG